MVKDNDARQIANQFLGLGLCVQSIDTSRHVQQELINRIHGIPWNKEIAFMMYVVNSITKPRNGLDTLAFSYAIAIYYFPELADCLVDIFTDRPFSHGTLREDLKAQCARVCRSVTEIANRLNEGERVFFMRLKVGARHRIVIDDYMCTWVEMQRLRASKVRYRCIY